MRHPITAAAVLSLSILAAAGVAPSGSTGGAAPAGGTSAFTPTADYLVRTMRGWTVRVNPALTADSALCAATLEELDHQLYAIVRAVPAEALTRLRTIPIWAELEMPKTACMCYHVSRDWLGPNGYNPDKERSVEIGNARAFVEWTHAQPWMVLHELSHGFHDQVYGYDHAEITAGWERAVNSGRFEKAAHISGGTERHYAMTNQMEWFSEWSEALFGTNDFYPFVRSELRAADPEGAALVERLWRNPPALTPAAAP